MVNIYYHIFILKHFYIEGTSKGMQFSIYPSRKFVYVKHRKQQREKYA